MAITREDTISRTNQLIDRAAEAMKANVEKLLDSGAIDLEAEPNNFSLPKHIITALLEDETTQYTPPTFWSSSAKRLWRKTVNNLKSFL